MSNNKFQPIQQRDNQGAIIPFSFANCQYRVSKAGLSNPVYIGYARSQIDADEPAWMIIKQEYDSSSDIIHVKHGVTGDSQQAFYDKVWDDSVAIEIASIDKAAVGTVTTSVAHGLTTGDLIEIMDSDMTEVNGNGYGIVMFTVKVTAPTTFTLVNPATGLDVNTSSYVQVGSSGDVFKRTYGTHIYA